MLNMLLNKRSKTWNRYLIYDFKAHALSLSLFSITLAISLIVFRYALWLMSPNNSRALIMKSYWTLLNAFLYLCRLSWLFVLHFICIICYTYWLDLLIKPCILWWCPLDYDFNPFIVFLNLIYKYFVANFCIFDHQEKCSIVFFLLCLYTFWVAG